MLISSIPAVISDDRAVLMDKGRIIADGVAKEIMSDAELMSGHGLEVPALGG